MPNRIENVTGNNRLAWLRDPLELIIIPNALEEKKICGYFTHCTCHDSPFKR
jgi:hypothetical protein